MKTPCVAACKNNDGICGGFHRTMDESIKWREMSSSDRDAVMNALSGIESTHQCPSCNKPAVCDISLGKETCWCFSVEKRDTSSLDTHNTCLCRKCLSALPCA
ncbi:DUF1289 domain-containing protein [Vibrio hepatarius]|uniref:DUF1289 domain-containing protein n=1 Tax=Vibrio hepatarius TaxID=171383 RepID=UPI00142D59EA|nr:DUF1289 domain-containing protein [Vibrio hepatarius]NIY84286.1 DUF1289 domain-containing protein [Vibrio hepatarius]